MYVLNAEYAWTRDAQASLSSPFRQGRVMELVVLLRVLGVVVMDEAAMVEFLRSLKERAGCRRKKIGPVRELEAGTP